MHAGSSKSEPRHAVSPPAKALPRVLAPSASAQILCARKVCVRSACLSCPECMARVCGMCMHADFGPPPALTSGLARRVRPHTPLLGEPPGDSGPSQSVMGRHAAGWLPDGSGPGPFIFSATNGVVKRVR